MAHLPQIVGAHPTVRALVTAAERLGRTRDPVAIIGERGTGKELFARHLHQVAGRSSERFVRIDCAEPEERRLVQQLFEIDGGWRRASGGTLLLDGLPALPLTWQEQLLGEMAATPREKWPHVVVSADRDLACGRSGGCLHDALVTALNPIEVVLPALRQRRCDIPALVQHFLGFYAARHDVRTPIMETEALVALWEHDWPGNVRELESVVERIVVLCRDGRIRSGDLPATIGSAGGSRRRRLAASPAPVTAAALRAVL